MNFLWIVSLAVQVYFAVHAYRNGKAIWIFIILFFPLAGVLIYFFAEYLPEMRHGTNVEQVSAGVVKKFAPERELRRLKEQVAFNNSVDNRVALAWGHMNVGQFDEAIEILNGCLEGAYRDDPKILSALAQAYIGGGRTPEALDTLTRIREEHPRFDPKGIGVLIARTLEHMDDLEAARREYQAILPESVGEEVRCRYALLLKKLGRDDDARAQFEELLRHAKDSPRYYRKMQRRWIQTARQELQPNKATK